MANRYRRGDKLRYTFDIIDGEFEVVNISSDPITGEVRRESGPYQRLALGYRNCALVSMQQLETLPIYLMYLNAKHGRNIVRKIVRSIRIARGASPLYRKGKLVRCHRVNGKIMPVEIRGCPQQFLDACERIWICWEIAHDIPVRHVM